MLPQLLNNYLFYFVILLGSPFYSLQLSFKLPVFFTFCFFVLRLQPLFAGSRNDIARIRNTTLVTQRLESPQTHLPLIHISDHPCTTGKAAPYIPHVSTLPTL